MDRSKSHILSYRPDARYKISVVATSADRLLSGNIRVWYTGGMFGTSDVVLRLCPGAGCTGVNLDPDFTHRGSIPDKLKAALVEEGAEDKDVTEWTARSVGMFKEHLRSPVTCQTCGNQYPRATWVADQWSFGKQSPGAVAVTVASFFRSVGCSADIDFIMLPNMGSMAKYREELSDGRHSAAFTALDKSRKKDRAVYMLSKLQNDMEAGRDIISILTSFFSGG